MTRSSILSLFREGFGLLAACGLLATASPVLAIEEAPIPTAAPTATGAPPPSDSTVVNLIRILVQNKVISQEAANALMAQAEYESKLARSAAGPSAPAPGVARVQHVPETVKDEIKDQVREEVLARARNEGWTQAGSVPGWVNRVELSGDFRVRSQSDFYSDSNAPEYIDYARVNATGPVDLTVRPNLPFLNTREDRLGTINYRARLGIRATVSDSLTVGVRLATGNNNSPVSTNQSLGGGFSKKDIWVDQAYATYRPSAMLSATAGRMANPFFRTDMIFDDDLNLDGVAVNAQTLPTVGGLNLFATAGAFPLDYTGSNDPTNSVNKESSRTKWLKAVQLGARWQPDDTRSLRVGLGYYNFDNVRGQISAICDVNQQRQCSSDNSRPAFMQKGNTLFRLRRGFDSSNVSNAAPQFVGLSHDYNVLDLTAEYETVLAGYRKIGIQASVLRNLAFDKDEIFYGSGFDPVNNYEEAGLGPYKSGGDAFMARATFGDQRMRARGDFSVAAGYKYIEPDAVLDGLNDSDFRLGGTNARGYFLTGSYGLMDNSWVSARWLSASEVYGDSLSIDVLQLEFNTSF